MLEYFFKSRWHLQNLRQGPLSTHIDGLAARLNRLGFTKGSARRYLCRTGKFNDFARSDRVETGSPGSFSSNVPPISKNVSAECHRLAPGS